MVAKFEIDLFTLIQQFKQETFQSFEKFENLITYFHSARRQTYCLKNKIALMCVFFLKKEIIKQIYTFFLNKETKMKFNKWKWAPSTSEKQTQFKQTEKLSGCQWIVVWWSWTRRKGREREKVDDREIDKVKKKSIPHCCMRVIFHWLRFPLMWLEVQFIKLHRQPIAKTHPKICTRVE